MDKNYILELEIANSDKIFYIRNQQYSKAAVARDNEKRILKLLGYPSNANVYDVLNVLKYEKRKRIDNFINNDDGEPI
jgi:hypothetical protein